MAKDSEELNKIQAYKKPAISTMPDLDKLITLSDHLAKSKMFPGINDKYQALAIIEYGRELGIKPIMALQSMCVINGKVALESKVLLALAKDNGIQVTIIEKNTKKCVLKFERGEESHTEKFTWEDVTRANLDRKANYLTYPEEMLFWRCVAKGLRVFDPGLGLGLYTREELEAGVEQETIELDTTKKKTEKKAKPEPEPTPEEEVIDAEVIYEKDEKPKEAKPVKQDPPKKKEKPEEKKKEEKAPPGLEAKEEEEEPKEDSVPQERPENMTKEEKAEYFTAQMKEDFSIRFGPNKKKVDDTFREFKAFLMDWQRGRKPERHFVAFNEFSHISMGLGDGDDLEALFDNRGWVLGEWSDWEKEQEKIVDEIGKTTPDDISK